MMKLTIFLLALSQVTLQSVSSHHTQGRALCRDVALRSLIGQSGVWGLQSWGWGGWCHNFLLFFIVFSLTRASANTSRRVAMTGWNIWSEKSTSKRMSTMRTVIRTLRRFHTLSSNSMRYDLDVILCSFISLVSGLWEAILSCSNLRVQQDQRRYCSRSSCWSRWYEPSRNYEFEEI